MAKEKFPQREYAEFVDFEGKPTEFPVLDEEKKIAESEIDTRRSYIVSPEGDIQPPQIPVEPIAPTETNKESMLPARIANKETGVIQYKKKETGMIPAVKKETGMARYEKKETGVATIPQPETKKPVRVAREDLAHQIETAKKDYINDYTRSIEKMSGFKRDNWFGVKSGIAKVADWFGFKNKHTWNKKETEQSQKQYADRSELPLLKRVIEVEKDFVNGNRVRNKRFDAQGNETVTANEAFTRYRQIMEKIEQRREEARRADGGKEYLAEMKKTRDEIQAERENAWPKSKVMEYMRDKLSVLNQHPAFRNTIGNKYVRFGLMTGIVGAATGGLGSALFYGTRAARFLGGAAAGGLARKGLDAWVKEEKILQKEIDAIDAQYQSKKMTQGQYDSKRLSIDMYMQRIKRGKEAAGIAAGLVGAAGAGYAAHGVGDFIQEKTSGFLVPQGVAYENPPVPVQNPEDILPPQPPYEYPKPMEVSSDGALDTMAKLKAQYVEFYADKDPSVISPLAHHIMDTPSAELAKEIDAWDPDAADGKESHTIPKHSTISGKDGALAYHNSVTGADTKVLATMGSRAGEVVVPTSNHLDMFDSGAHAPVDAPLDSSATIEKTIPAVSEIENNTPDPALAAGGLGSPSEEMIDKKLESDWFVVKDESGITDTEKANAAGASNTEVRTPTTVEPIESQPGEFQIRRTVPSGNILEEKMGMRTVAPFDHIIERNPEPLPLVDGNATMAPFQGNEPVEMQAGSPIESEQPIVSEPEVEESTPETKNTIPNIEGKQLVSMNPNTTTGQLLIQLDGNGEYQMAGGSTVRLLPETAMKLGNAENYLEVGKKMSDISLVEQKATNIILNYRVLDGLLKYGGLVEGSPAYQAVVNAAHAFKVDFDKAYGPGILKDITVPQPVR